MSAIDQYNLTGENVDSIISSYIQNKQAQIGEEVTGAAFLGSGVLRSLHDIYNKGSKLAESIEKTPERLENLAGKIENSFSKLKNKAGELVEGVKGDIKEAGEGLLNKGKSLLNSAESEGLTALKKSSGLVEGVKGSVKQAGEGLLNKGKSLLNSAESEALPTLKKSNAQLSYEFENTAKGLQSHTEEALNKAITGSRNVLQKGVNEGHQAFLNFKSSTAGQAQRLRESAFNTDPEESEHALSGLAKLKSGVNLEGIKSVGEDVANRSKSIISSAVQETQQAVKSATSELAEKVAGRAAGALGEVAAEGSGIAAAAGGILEPVILAADIGAGLFSLIKGIEAPKMPQISIPTLQIMGPR